MKNNKKDTINIAVFGAIRPLKNHLIQAISAIQFANEEGLKLYFHINGTRIENNGDPVLKNLRELFEGQEKHELVEHCWMEHDKFVELLQSMDICMQVSFSETYNIVTADAVNGLVPVVVSPELRWVFGLFKANPVDSNNIVSKLRFTYYTEGLGLEYINKGMLWWNSFKAEVSWMEYFTQEGMCKSCGCVDCTC